METHIELFNNINENIAKYHNPNLVQKDQSPNENTIYHLYNDGSITSQKGGWAYLQRHEITIEYAVNSKYEFDFPLSNSYYKYAIMDFDNAKHIRNLIIEYHKKMKN
jgi:hypothetical protein